MSKRTMVILLIAAAAAVGFILWRRRQMVAVGGTIPHPTVAPSQVSPQAVVANAFSDLLNIGANSLAQWFRDRTAKPAPGPEVTPLKPPPLTSQGPSSKVPAASTPNLVTTPTYFA